MATKQIAHVHIKDYLRIHANKFSITLVIEQLSLNYSSLQV